MGNFAGFARERFEALKRVVRIKNDPCMFCTDFFINEEQSIAVVGIQLTNVSDPGAAVDVVYVIRQGNEAIEEVFRRDFPKDRMRVTGIAEDGKSFSYIIKGEDGKTKDFTHPL